MKAGNRISLKMVSWLKKICEDFENQKIYVGIGHMSDRFEREHGGKWNISEKIENCVVAGVAEILTGRRLNFEGAKLFNTMKNLGIVKGNKSSSWTLYALVNEIGGENVSFEKIVPETIVVTELILDRYDGLACDTKITSRLEFMDDATTARTARTCQYCNKILPSGKSKNRHKLSCSENQNCTAFDCDICGRSFRRKDTLNYHMVTHINARDFTCCECNESFKRQSILTNHMKTHDNHREHRCVICSATFNRKGHLDEHLKTHKNLREFKCPQCDVSFNRKTTLTDHIRYKHINARKKSCPICGQTFNRGTTLKTHMKIHESDNGPDRCLKCGANFNGIAYLKIHLKKAPHNV